MREAMTRPDTAPPPAQARGRRKETRTADGDGSLYFDKQARLWRGELMVGYRPDPNDPSRLRGATGAIQRAIRGAG
jgi:hypothetical protein